MLESPLMLKFLVFGTLLIGSLSLLGNFLPTGRPHLKTRRMLGAVRAPLGQAQDDEKDDEKTVRKTDAQWQKDLTPEQYRIARQSGTERAFTGEFWDHHDEGSYLCVGCGQELFSSAAKYDSGSGWPSYDRPAAAGAVSEIKDITGGIVRTEVVCSRCESHLGHVFPDGRRTTGLRYCINSASLTFEPDHEVPTEIAQ